MSPILAVREIDTAYGRSRVLFGVSLTVAEGECVCLLGRNGAGKTTTMKSIIGLTPPSRGEIRWKGIDITRWPPFRVARAGVGLVPEDRRVFADLAVLENLQVAQQVASRPGPWNIEAVFSLFPKLAEIADRQSGFLSGGEQQMLTIARTLMTNPELLLLDEPSEGLAPLVVEQLVTQVGELKRRGMTILLAEQSLEFCLALADRIYVIEKGQVRFEGGATALKEDPRLRENLLGLAGA